MPQEKKFLRPRMLVSTMHKYLPNHHHNDEDDSSTTRESDDNNGSTDDDNFLPAEMISVLKLQFLYNNTIVMCNIIDISVELSISQ